RVTDPAHPLAGLELRLSAQALGTSKPVYVFAWADTAASPLTLGTDLGPAAAIVVVDAETQKPVVLRSPVWLWLPLPATADLSEAEWIDLVQTIEATTAAPVTGVQLDSTGPRFGGWTSIALAPSVANAAQAVGLRPAARRSFFSWLGNVLSGGKVSRQRAVRRVPQLYGFSPTAAAPGTLVLASGYFGRRSPSSLTADIGGVATFVSWIAANKLNLTVPGVQPGQQDVGIRIGSRLLQKSLFVLPRPDTAPPATRIDSGPPAVTNAATVTFTFSADEPSTFECQLDAGEWVSCTSPLVLAPIGEGAHVLRVRARDLAGNVDPTAEEYGWYVDRTAPSPIWLATPPASTTLSDATVEFTCDDTSCRFLCALDGAPFAACDSPLAVTAAQPGTHDVKLMAGDDVGNWSAAISVTWVVELPRLIGVGSQHACASKPSNGQLFCWGYNGDGAVGDNGPVVARTTPSAVAVTQAYGWTDLSLGTQFGCGIRDDDTLWCWGRNSSGQLGDGTYSARYTPVPISATSRWLDVNVGATHSCAVRDDATLWCWGSNSFGELGVGDKTIRSVPTRVTGSTQWRQVSAGSFETCAIDIDGLLWCWGRNALGELGTGDTQPRTSPVPIVAPGPWKSVDIGGVGSNNTICAIDSNDRAFCWGANTYGQLGAGDHLPRVAPAEVSNPARWRDISVGLYSVCGVALDRRPYCWGQNTYGQLGAARLDIADATQPYPVAFTKPAVDIETAITSCLVDGQNDLYCWGNNQQGTVGDGAGGEVHPDPVTITAAQGWEKLRAGQGGAGCAIDVMGTLYCWGSSTYLGNPQYYGSWTSNPVNVGDHAWLDASTTGNYSCGISTDTTLWCWGQNGAGQLGTGDFSNTFIPALADGGSTGWARIRVAANRSCAIRNGELYCWGSNGSSVLGVSSTTWAFPDPVPMAIPQPVDVVLGSGSCAVTAAGGLWCWGMNTRGQLGLGYAGATVTYPVETTFYADWMTVAVANETTCGIRTGGTLWCWGGNNYGLLGIGSSQAFSNVPVQVTVGSGAWEAIGGGNSYFCGLQDDGSIWCWGWNYYGQLGDGTTNSWPYPVRATQRTDWIELSVGLEGACARAADGTVECWGKQRPLANGDWVRAGPVSVRLPDQ
ncbi:MAG: hypothetical protein D6761_03900, partial [Candidatus Dadabacteria bacterium]